MKLENVVVGVDFGEGSPELARWVARHLAPDGVLVLAHTVQRPPRPQIFAELLPPPEETIARAIAGAEARSTELVESLGGDRSQARAEVREGRPADVIAAIAEEVNADLIVVGPHGHRRGIWGGLGSTAEHLVRSCQRPVLLARVTGGPPTSILAPVDESALTDPVLRWTAFLAKRYGATATAVHVLSLVLHSHLRLVSSPDKTREVEQDALRAAGEWLAGRLRAAGLDPAEAGTEIAFGHPAYEILAAAERRQSDLIVMGSRGAGMIGRAMIGSVASAVLRGAPCSVMVVDSARNGSDRRVDAAPTA